jgi:hypothetical protein
MTIVHRVILEGQNDDPVGLVIYIGSLTLVAGSAQDTIAPQVPNKFSDNVIPLVSRFAAGGAVGHLTADFNRTTGVITVTSSSGTDTSSVVYLLLSPG